MIFIAAADCEHVALIPRHYFKRLDKVSTTAKRVNFITATEPMHWLLHAIPAFPPEWAPFVFEISELGQA